MSVFVERLIREAGADAVATMIDLWPNRALIGFLAETARQEGLVACMDPNDGPKVGAAHAHVLQPPDSEKRSMGKGQAKKISRGATVLYHPDDP